jgi:hypothetical protein
MDEHQSQIPTALHASCERKAGPTHWPALHCPVCSQEPSCIAALRLIKGSGAFKPFPAVLAEHGQDHVVPRLLVEALC